MSLFAKLIDTNLKHLKWGQNGTQGDSTVPYIVTDINDINDSIRYNLIREDEGILRGGKIGSRTASDIDTIRIKRFLEDPLKGPFFIYKQKILQQSNPAMETEGNDQLAKQYGGYTRFYNDGKNTLAQVSLTASGIHIARHGENSFTTQGKYTEVMDSLNFGYFSTYTDNRLYKLYKKLFNIGNGGGEYKNDRINPNLPYATLDGEINKWGPNNSNGLGETKIRRFVYSGMQGRILKSLDKTYDKINQFSNDHIKYTNFSINGDDDKTTISSRIKPKVPLDPDPTDRFRMMDYKTEYNVDGKTNPNSYNGFKQPPVYKHYIQEGKGPIVLSVKGQSKLDNKKLVRGKAADNFNYKIKEFISSYVKDNSSMEDKGIYGRDDKKILQVEFSQINPFVSETINEKQEFSGYINGYSENYSSNWNDIKYNGRAEFLYNFVSYKKTASFNLQIPIFRVEDIIPTHTKLKKLQNGLAGKYNQNRLGGIITQIKLGHYLRNQYCIINSLNIKIPDEASWDWGIFESEYYISAYSTLLEASFNVTVINDKISV